MPTVQDEAARYEAAMERLMGFYRVRMIELCREVDLTPPQFWALVAIRQYGPLKMSPLAEHLGLSMGAASTLIDRLVGRGLVRRASDALDRRAVYVSLSESAEAILSRATSSKETCLRRVFERLAPDTRSALVQGMEALAEAWAQEEAEKADLKKG